MTTRTVRAAIAAFIAVASGVAVLSVAAQPSDRLSRFAASPKTGTFTPASSFKRGSDEYVVKLSGDPVAVVRSRAPNKRISETDRSAIAATLRSQQDALEPAVRATGAKVTGYFQHALNGIKVRATPEQANALSKLPGVVSVKRVATYHLDNIASVPFIGAPQVWQGPPSLHGEQIKVAILDTGIDYTHANFGGPGTTAAFQAAAATSTQPADPALFGPAALKVKGGTDLVGDAYNASSKDPAKNTPMPDPNPLDCNGHGSHTAGTLAGFGVTASGQTFNGPYDSTTPSLPFTIGPGVAPRADLYAVRVFGCGGSATTAVIVDGIDWAVQHDMQVISMSLGGDYGIEDSADAEASENAVSAGMVVAAASGNAGPAPYITSTPGTGEHVLSVAAIDSHPTFGGETLALSPSGSVVALKSNGIGETDGTSLPVFVLPDTKGTGSGGVSRGCDPAEYTAANVTGKLVVVLRGSCARVAKAIYGQQGGAAAVAMINTAAGYPPFEGPIKQNPDTGAAFTVTIPFLGIQGPSPSSGDGATLVAAASASFTATAIANPGFRKVASFSSAGPRSGDGAFKPNVSAPGVSVFSTAIGTGNDGTFISGTSMATPHVAGSAALAVQAHPDWSAQNVATALANTSDSSQLVAYSPRKNGTGLIQPSGATRTGVIAMGADGNPSLSFGVAEFTKDFSATRTMTVQNVGHSSASFSVAVVPGGGSAHTATASVSSLTVAAGQRAALDLQLSVPAVTVGDSSAFRQVQGNVVLTPTSGNDGVSLSVPYYLVPRARSLVQASLNRSGEESAQVGLRNRSSLITGTADFYAWGLRGTNSALGQIGLRSVGVQSFDAGAPFGQVLVFAVNTFAPWSNVAADEFDLLIDVNRDGVPDYDLFAADFGLVTTGFNNGQFGVFVVNLSTAVFTFEPFAADARTDSNVVLIPAVASDVGVTASNPRFAYTIQSFDNAGTLGSDAITAPARFNAFSSSITFGPSTPLADAFATLAPNATASVPIRIHEDEFEATPALGLLIVSEDNPTTSQRQVLLLPLRQD